MFEFKMPSLGAFLEAGSLVEWKVKPGDRVKRGDIVAVVDTDKAAIEIEIWQDGVIRDLVVQPGEKVPVGAVLAKMSPDGELTSPAPAARLTEGVPPAAPPERKEALPPEQTVAAPVHLRASPAARQRARELGVAIDTIAGSGPGGAITLADVERTAAQMTGFEPPVAEAPTLAPMRRAIALAMERSNRDIPHYYLSSDLDMTAALGWLEAHNATRPATERILPAALLLKAVARAVAHVPELNGFWQEGAFRPSREAHVGVAIWLRQGGLVIPALHDVANKPLAEVMRSLSDLTNRARAGRLTSREITEATLTVTNLGDRGAMTVQGVIFPPQVALVGFGRISARPWVAAGELTVKEAVTATLAADHRASDGHAGSRFLETLGQLLWEPERL